MKGTLFILQEYLTYASCLDATVGSRGVLTPYFMNIPSPLYYYKNKPPFLNLSPLPPPLESFWYVFLAKSRL